MVSKSGVGASSSTNATDHKGLKEHHNLGSQSLARVLHEATSDENVVNAFFYVTKKESDMMLIKIEMKEYPYLDETGLELARREIDYVDPYIRARVWTTFYLPKGSHYRRRYGS
ncbi:hypothetical protein OROGR_026809 [Orobanche gracilis]